MLRQIEGCYIFQRFFSHLMLPHLLTNCQRVLVSFGQSHVVEFYRNKHVTEDMLSLANATVGQSRLHGAA